MDDWSIGWLEGGKSVGETNTAFTRSTVTEPCRTRFGYNRAGSAFTRYSTNVPCVAVPVTIF